jgi:hypothetical protein
MPTKIEVLEKWAGQRNEGECAAVTLRIALRGLRPLFEKNGFTDGDIQAFNVFNLAYVHMVMERERSHTKTILERVRNAGVLAEANLLVRRVDYYEGASARRQSRASSSNEEFADGVLRRAASATVDKLRKTKTDAKVLVARAMAVLASEAFDRPEALLEAAGLLSRSLSSLDRADFWISVSSDCENLDQKKSVEELFRSNLWQGIPSEVELANESSEAFWRYWYQGFVQGRPLATELLRDVALSYDGQSAGSGQAMPLLFWR